MNPLSWTRWQQIALVFAAVFGGGMGIVFGLHRFDPQTAGYWPDMCLWGVLGSMSGAAVGYLSQLLERKWPRQAGR
ncbi:MAG TPA: hypothetical protein VNU97_12880 [Rhizomicrobium sp.]|jgi:hypothetical protein|nr:hypothetical protein [Rhizomicrobium sp.]